MLIAKPFDFTPSNDIQQFPYLALGVLYFSLIYLAVNTSEVKNSLQFILLLSFTAIFEQLAFPLVKCGRHSNSMT